MRSIQWLLVACVLLLILIAGTQALLIAAVMQLPANFSVRNAIPVSIEECSSLATLEVSVENEPTVHVDNQLIEPLDVSVTNQPYVYIAK